MEEADWEVGNIYSNFCFQLIANSVSNSRRWSTVQEENPGSLQVHLKVFDAFCAHPMLFQVPRVLKSWPSGWTKVLTMRSTWASNAKIWRKKMGEKRRKGFSKRKGRDVAGTHLLMCRSHRGGTRDSLRFLTNVEKCLVPTSWQISKYLSIRIWIQREEA